MGVFCKDLLPEKHGKKIIVSIKSANFKKQEKSPPISLHAPIEEFILIISRSLVNVQALEGVKKINDSFVGRTKG